MANPLARIPGRMLLHASAWALASILAGCGGDDGGYQPPPPAEPAGLTYDVIPLSLGGIGASGFVGRKGITANGKVAGTIDVADGSLHAFVYDGNAMIDLGTMGGVPSINQLGQVVGKDDAFHAFLYDGTMHDLGTLGGTDSLAYAINERGQVTGESTGSDGIRSAFLYRDGVMKPLKTPGVPSTGRVINAGGEEAGLYDDPNHFTRSFLWAACDCARDLGTLGGNQSFVFAINDAGQLAGVSEDGSSHRHAFLYENGAMKDLGTFGGGIAEAFALNAAGWVAGYALTGTGDAHAFVYDGKMLRDLGTLGGHLSEATSINSSGQVTGYAYTAKGEQHAMTWTDAGGMVDLNTVLRGAPAGMVLINGYAISDNGAIVAQANPGLVLLKPHYGPK